MYEIEIGASAFVACAGPWSCGRHPRAPAPKPEHSRYFERRLERSISGMQIRAGFVLMSRAEGDELDADPDAIYRRQAAARYVSVDVVPERDLAALVASARAFACVRLPGGDCLCSNTGRCTCVPKDPALDMTLCTKCGRNLAFIGERA
jgi:hypothetical protein